MRTGSLASLLIVLLIAGCGGAHDVVARFPSPGVESTGTIVLILSQPADDVTVAINGVLVVEDVHTKRLVIERVPTGSVDIVLAGNGGDKAMRVWLDGDHPTTIPIGIPEAGGASFAKSLLGTILTIVVYSLIHR